MQAQWQHLPQRLERGRSQYKAGHDWLRHPATREPTPPDVRMATEWRRAIERGELPLIIVYERPADFPDECVARLWLTRRGVAEPVMTGLVLRSASLETLREMLPLGLHCLPREPDDEESIVETWI